MVMGCALLETVNGNRLLWIMIPQKRACNSLSGNEKEKASG